MLEDAHFFLRLSMETLLVAHHFKSHVHVTLVVVCLYHLPKAALADYLQHLVTVCYVVVRDMNV